jgi:dienelactone hydrolase
MCFDYDDEQTPEFGFNADAARRAHERMIAFLQRHLD